MINTLNDLIKASNSFMMPAGKIAAKEKGRLEFISKFPQSSIQNLSLDEYCIGTSDDSFCYWLERKEAFFGIGGGNASKFGIYKSLKDDKYYEDAGPNKKPLEGDVLKAKFSSLKQSIVQSLKCIEQNEIEKISSIPTTIWNMVLLKIFTLYYPHEFLTIGDPDVIIECARSIGITGVEFENKNSILLNYLCKKKINETAAFASWEDEKIGTFVWETFSKTAKRDYYIIGSKYGENADIDVFPQMLNRSVIATGFAADLDLSEYYNETHANIKEYLEEQEEESKSINALKHFLSLKPGDLVAVKADGSPKGNEGYLSIVGIAEVVEKNGKVYEYDPQGLGHIIHVKYLNAPIFKELSLGGYGRTMHKLSNEEHIKLIFKSNIEMSYYEELNKFLAQAKAGDLGTASYLNNYLGLKVKVSFGQGNQARIPWIAFLLPDQTVQDGIYPVYLYFKDLQLLILAYGISETNKPQENWKLSSGETITTYFSKHNLGQPQRYGSSFVFKTYDINQSLDEAEITKDLNDLIEIYKSTLSNTPMPKQITTAKADFKYNLFNEHAINANLFLSEKTSLRFIASLLTKPFVILTGLSGSGKTKLAQAFASWICEDKDQYCIVPVGADWTNREPLLGFPNALKEEDYVKPDNKALDIIIAANENSDKPYFLILDEMNLSHVERYFADFLSVMESKNKISLHAGSNEWNGVPAAIGFPKNLFIIGTVNIDETTYMFSPKVLDRSNVIEFSVTADEMENYLGNGTALNLDGIAGLGVNMGNSFVDIATDNSMKTKDPAEINDALLSFFKELKKTGAEFGYRTASEILRFAAIINNIEPGWSMQEIIDAAIMQKLLPKVHGSKRKLEPVLKALGTFCLKEGDNFETYLTKPTSTTVIYPISLEKIVRMYNNLLSNSFTSYAEA